MRATSESGRPEEGIGEDPATRARLAADERRWVVLQTLYGRAPPIALDTLAEAVAAAERDEPSDEAVETVAVSLHHHHLPLMADLGVLDYDGEENRVTAHRGGSFAPRP